MSSIFLNIWLSHGFPISNLAFIRHRAGQHNQSGILSLDVAVKLRKLHHAGVWTLHCCASKKHLKGCYKGPYRRTISYMRMLQDGFKTKTECCDSWDACPTEWVHGCCRISIIGKSPFVGVQATPAWHYGLLNSKGASNIPLFESGSKSF